MYTPSEADALIIEAAANGDLKKLKEMREKIGDDYDFRKRCDLVNDCEGRRVLHFAARKGKIEMCKFLIEEVNVLVDIKTERGDTPLLYAVEKGHIKAAGYFIDHGAEISMSDSKGYTSLHYAVQRDNKELVQLLLMKGANIEAKSVDGTPLQCAASSSVEIVEFLLAHGAEPNSVCMLSGSPLISAIKSHSFECMELLLKAGADPDKSLYGLSPLALAASEGQTKCIKSLLAFGANPDSVSTDHLRPIEHAALKHNGEVVGILFSVSRKLLYYPDWSVHGIMEYFHSEEAKTMREQMRNVYLDSVKHEGKSAWIRKDYSSAIRWYSEAIYLDPNDEKMLSNRSLCWSHLGEGVFALHDAEECIKLKPQWHKAHYMEGTAWKLLQNYHKSANAFKRALKLAPQNNEILNAYREILAKLILEMYTRYPLEALSFIHRHLD